MADRSNETRDRVRALVREVLDKVPVEQGDTRSEFEPEHVVVNSILEASAREFDRDESGKSLITEDDLRGLEEGSRIRIARNAKFTPLALDIVNDKRFRLIHKEDRGESLRVKSVGLAADHGGFETKEKLKEYLAGMGIQVRDFGTSSTDAVDYPDFAHAVAAAVGAGHVEAGIVIDGAGIGSAMAANKVPRVRAAACYSPSLARNAREHNGANMLALGSGQNSFEEIKDIVTAFLSSEIIEERHKRRVEKIGSIERQYTQG